MLRAGKKKAHAKNRGALSRSFWPGLNKFFSPLGPDVEIHKATEIFSCLPWRVNGTFFKFTRLVKETARGMDKAQANKIAQRIIPSSPKEIFPFLVIFRPVDFSKIRCLVFDLNNTLTADFSIEPYIRLGILKGMLNHEILSSPEERFKFLISIQRWGSSTCIYQKGMLVLERGHLFLPSSNGKGKLLDRDGRLLGEAEWPREDFFVISGDVHLMLRALFMRRGSTKDEAERVHAEAFCKAGQYGLKREGFNTELKRLFLPGNRKIMYVVSDNRKKVVEAFCEQLGLQAMISQKHVISEAEKSLNYSRILADIALKHHLEPHEIMVVGDSLKSDILPAQAWSPAVRTALITLGNPGVLESAVVQGIVPDIAAPTLNDLIKYLLQP